MRRPSLSMFSDHHAPAGRSALNTALGVAAAFAAGALVMYLLDPVAGRRRRAVMRDRSVAMGYDAGHFVQGKGKRAADRVKGALARTRDRLSSTPLDDDLLHDRIRSRLGRLVDRPGAVEVHVREGRVQLKGTVSEAEFHDLIHTVSSMRGVTNLESLLRTAPMHASPPSPFNAGAPH
ncbi:BON domain-containing protein [Lysobacter sp. LF1]|uniref:BON domain-containing protein n=1 Tax=Lysobacter stagni TaxID=3045172 RepID=A0ABT6XHF1_9GAMM|nr:BON domain-containing protein [Lysobacter sp. LF1]MDI9239576.1 BON domain-containing protein [Lysobacter sp. LF1]